MSRYKKDGYQRYTYDPQSQVDKCLECKKSVAECNVCAANPKAKYKKFIDEKVVELWRRGLYDVEIAKALDTTVSRVSRIRSKYNLSVNYYPKYKKLDPEKVLELWESGKKDAEIARVFGCQRETVRKTRVKLGLPPQRRRNK